MGNDGGSIPKRRELVREAARQPTAQELKETQQEQQDHLWKTDPLTNQPLAKPIVSDALGRLYNKESIIEYLLPSDDSDAASEKKEQKEILRDTVKSLKDVVEVKLESDSKVSEKLVCPVTHKQLGAGSKTVYLVPCGHAFAEATIKEIADTTCLQCNENYAPEDVIPILPTSATDIARLTLRMQTLKDKGLTHALKKASGRNKKRKKGEADDSTAQTTQPSGIKNSATASLTAKVMEEQAVKKRKTKSETIESLFTTDKGNEVRKDGRHVDFMSMGYAIPGK